VKTLANAFIMSLAAAAEAHPAQQLHVDLPAQQLHPLLVTIGVVIVWAISVVAVEKIATRRRRLSV
jgi:hypothetical protein